MEGSVCSQFDTAQLKPKHFCAGNRASGLSPCFKLRRIRDTVKKYDLRRDILDVSHREKPFKF